VTVTVELDADPPRLRRADGLCVRFPRDENGSYLAIETGWLKADGEFELLFRWRGFTYQELQPAASGEALLVGHVPRGGYASAVASLNEYGVGLDFADRVAADENGVERIQVAIACRTGLTCKYLSDAAYHFEEEETGASELSRRRLTMTRKSDANAFAHQLALSLRGKSPK
jgi:hypothetical protein